MASTRRGPLKGMAKKLPTVADKTIEWAIKEARRPAILALSSDTGGDRRLSGLRGGKPLSVVVRKRSVGRLVEADVYGGPGRQRAPWFWLNEGTQAGPRTRRRRGGVTTYRHPGTAAKRTWDRAIDPVVPRIAAQFTKNVTETMQ